MTNPLPQMLRFTQHDMFERVSYRRVNASQETQRSYAQWPHNRFTANGARKHLVSLSVRNRLLKHSKTLSTVASWPMLISSPGQEAPAKPAPPACSPRPSTA